MPPSAPGQARPAPRRSAGAGPSQAAPRDAAGLRLYVAEKPSVARDLARVLGASQRQVGAYVGAGIAVTWCIGHMAELAPPEAYDPKWRAWRREFLPMLPETFALRVNAHNAQHWPVLQGWLKRREVTEVVNACDAGREGELIFRYVLQLAGVRKPVRRLWLNALTDAAIRTAVRALRPQADYDALADAARCRAEADWLVGLNATRAMTLVRRHQPGGGELCSVGRVQTPTLAMVGGRDEAIEAFVSEPFYEVWAELAKPTDPADKANKAGQADGPDANDPASAAQPRTSADAPAAFSALAQCPPGQALQPRPDGPQPPTPAQAPPLPAKAVADAAQSAPVAPPGAAAAAPLAPPASDLFANRFARKADAEAVVAQLEGATATVAAVTPQTEVVRPPLLYDLTALQRQANARYGLTAQETLQAAQALYERDKALTYPRTDSSYLPSAMAGHLPTLLRKLAGGSYAELVAPLVAGLDDGTLRPPTYVVDDAEVSDHHAIVPTGTPPANLAQDAAKRHVYDLVVRRFVAAWMPPARHARTAVKLRVGDTTLISRGRTTLALGWQAVDGPQRGAHAAAQGPQLPPLAVGEACRVRRARIKPGATQPPPHHSEATLLAAMERAGRLLTAPALRGALKDAGLGTPATRAATIEILKKRSYLRLEGRTLVCTPSGRALLDALPVAALKSAEMTGAWEAKLGQVARGKLSRAAFMQEIRREVALLVRAIAGDEPGPSVGRQPRAARPHSAAATRPGSLGWRLPAKLQCPVCRGKLVVGDSLLGCDKGRACSFVVFAEVAQRPLSEAEVITLLTAGTVGPLQGFVSRKGRKFVANLQLTGEGRVVFAFPPAEVDAPAAAPTP